MWPTFWVLQPVAVLVVQVAALKLLLAVIGDGHRDKWIHSVKALLGSNNSTQADGKLMSWEARTGIKHMHHVFIYLSYAVVTHPLLKNHRCKLSILTALPPELLPQWQDTLGSEFMGGGWGADGYTDLSQQIMRQVGSLWGVERPSLGQGSDDGSSTLRQGHTQWKY